MGLDTTYGGSVSDSVDTDTSIYRFSVIDSDPVSCLTTHTEFTVDPAPAPGMFTLIISANHRCTSYSAGFAGKPNNEIKMLSN